MFFNSILSLFPRGLIALLLPCLFLNNNVIQLVSECESENVHRHAEKLKNMKTWTMPRASLTFLLETKFVSAPSHIK